MLKNSVIHPRFDKNFVMHYLYIFRHMTVALLTKSDWIGEHTNPTADLLAAIS